MKKLRNYQEAAYKRGINGYPLLLADDRGLGKTVVGIDVALYYMQRLQSPALVIAPLFVCQQWIEEIKDQDVHKHSIIQIESSTVIPKPLISRKPYWIVTHYEALVKHSKRLQQTFYSIIIADEAHRIKNRKALRSIALKKLRTQMRLALTGTPYDRNPADLWSILNWLKPETFRSYWAFSQAHVLFEDTNGFPKPIGVNQPARFAKVLKPYWIRRSKQDVAPLLPQKQLQTIPLVLSIEQAKLYQRIRDVEIILTQDDDRQLLIKNTLGKILRLQQACVDPRLLGSSFNGVKIDWLLDWIDDNANETILVFTRFRDTALRVASLLSCPVIVGGQMLASYKEYPRLVATIDAAKEGLNLEHIWTTIFMDQHWSSIAMAQAIDRTERDLQATKPRSIITLQAQQSNGQATVDRLVSRALAEKWATADLINGFLKANDEALDIL